MLQYDRTTKKNKTKTMITRCGVALATVLVAATATTGSPKDAGIPAGATSPSGPGRDTIYYSRYNRDTPNQANIRRAGYSFDGTTLAFDTRRDIANLPGADGLLFAPDGDLLVGAQLDSVYKVRLVGKQTVERALCGGTGAYHLALDPSQKRLWVGGAQPGPLVEIPLDPFGPGTIRPLTGDDRVITQVQFTPGGRAFYTASSANGVGHFGRIDLNTFVTARHISSIPGAHAMAYDEYTGTMLLFGEKHILQIDTETSTILSDLDLSAHIALNQPFKNTIDQGTSDGEGRVVAAVNNGWMLLVDFTDSGLIGAPGNVVAAAYLDSFIDDIAPLSGLGARPGSGRKQPKGPKPPKPPGSPAIP